jgi:hypothetical protein
MIKQSVSNHYSQKVDLCCFYSAFGVFTKVQISDPYNTACPGKLYPSWLVLEGLERAENTVDSQLSREDRKLIFTHIWWKEYITKLWIGIYKMTHTFIGIFYMNAVGRNVSVVSKKPLYSFYTLKSKNLNKESLSFQVCIKTRNTTPFFWSCSFLKIDFTWSLYFDIGHTSQDNLALVN